MTTLDQALQNPYLDAFLQHTGGRRYELWSDPWPIASYEGLPTKRRDWCTRYAWAIPDNRAIRLLLEHAPLVEIGAGGGYWASLVRQHGGDIIAYDCAPGSNHWVNELWTHVEKGDARMSRHHGDRTLFLCWPPYSRKMARDALREYLNAGGQTVIYVGEHHGGCCADDTFFSLLEKHFEQTHEWNIPQYPGMHDYLTVWDRTTS